MFSVVYNNIQKITNISIKKPIILISILNKYLDIPIYLDNRTPLLVNQTHFPRGGTYRLEIISAPSEKVWSTAYTFYVLKNQRILSIVNWC